jgi:hypothetical protein
MKHYRMEPTYKKSVVENTMYSKDGVIATYEEGYRWGQFVIHIPETEEEFEAWATKFGMTLEEANDNYDYIFNDDSVDDKYLAICGPDLEGDHFDLDDYDHEMIELWDGCWAFWHVAKKAADEEFTDEEEEELIEHLQELHEDGYNDGYDDAVEHDGWEMTHCWTEVQSTITLVPCDEVGYIEEQEKDDDGA